MLEEGFSKRENVVTETRAVGNHLRNSPSRLSVGGKHKPSAHNIFLFL